VHPESRPHARRHCTLTLGDAFVLLGVAFAWLLYALQRQQAERRDLTSALDMLGAIREAIVPWGDLPFQSYSDASAAARAQNDRAAALQASITSRDLLMVWRVPTEPLATLIEHPAMGGLIRAKTVQDAVIALRQMNIFNQVGKQGTWELTYPATFAILAGFRNFLVETEDGTIEWKGGIAAVEQAWRALGAEMVIACQETAKTLPEHKMAVLLGRNRPLWTVLHKTVKEYLTRQEADEKTAELQAEIERLTKLAEQSGAAASA
jgi:hypothetical protein